MRYLTLPRVNLKVPRISLGTMTFGGQTGEVDSLKIMDYAYDMGVNLFDTANSYNQGASEQIVAKGLKGRRDAIILATKVFNPVGPTPNDGGLSRRHIVTAVEDSLRRLETDYIDLYYLHAPDHVTALEETLDTMNTLIHAGKIRYIGISNFPAWKVAEIMAICDKRNYMAPVITQNVYNPITRGIEEELLPCLKAHPLGLAIYNPIAGGLLAGKHQPGQPAGDTRFADNKMYYDRYWSEENFTAVEKLTRIAAARGLSLLELAMKWCDHSPAVTTIITGVSRLEQLTQNLTSLEGAPLEEAVMAECDEVWGSLAGTRFKYYR